MQVLLQRGDETALNEVFIIFTLKMNLPSCSPTFPFFIWFKIFQIREIYISEGWTSNCLPKGWLAKGDAKNYMFVAPNGTRIKGKVQAAAFLEQSGGSEEDKKLLAELNLLAKKTKQVKEEEEEEENRTSNGKRARFQPSPSQVSRLLEAFAENSLPSSEAKKVLAEEIGMAVKSVGFWFVNYRAKMTKKEKEAKEEEGKENEENMEVAKVDEKVVETKFGSENEALELISLLPGVNIKPISNKFEVNDAEEIPGQEKLKETPEVDEENILDSVNKAPKEVEQIKIVDIEKDAKNETCETVLKVAAENGESDQNEKNDHVETTNDDEEEEDNQNETMPKGWKRKGPC